MKTHLALPAVLAAILGIVLLHGAGAARQGLQPHAFLPVVEIAYDDIHLPAPAAWKVTQLSGPPGYATSVTAISNGGLLALSLTGEGIQLFRSLDEGENWGLIYEPVLGRDIGAYRLYAAPADLSEQAVLALGFSGLARSGDGGVSWQRVGGNLPVRQLVALAYSPDYETDATVYALSITTGGAGPYLYVSRDRGQTWETQADIPALRDGGLIPNDLAGFGPGALVIATSLGILRTQDGATTWHLVTEPFAEPGSDPAIRAVARLASGELLAVTSGRRIPYKSSDGGLTWRWTGYGMDEDVKHQGGLAVAVAPGRVFLAAAGAQGGDPDVFYSPQGDSWRAIPLGLEPGAGISAIYAIFDDKLLVAAGEHGLWKGEAIP